jgi:hypothetical protein
LNFLYRLYIDKKRIEDNSVLKQHLDGIKIEEYGKIFNDLGTLSNFYKIWVSPMSSYAVYNAVTNKVTFLKKISQFKLKYLLF